MSTSVVLISMRLVASELVLDGRHHSISLPPQLHSLKLGAGPAAAVGISSYMFRALQTAFVVLSQL